ncbi:MAG: Sec-independent protein translocase protein TatB [Mycobacteriaceae bacterium]
MFSNVGWGDIFILLVAGLVILGPERLPGAMQWVAKTIKQVKIYASGATQQLKEELGPEFDDLRKPLAEIQQLRTMSPRSVITKHLLDGDDSLIKDLTGGFDEKPANTRTQGSASAKSVSLEKGQQPPIDYDAT